MSAPFERRIEACRRRLEEAGADLIVCFPSPNLTYLSGFEETPSERHLWLFVPESGAPALLAPTMYEAQLAELPISGMQLHLWGDADDPLETAADVIEGYSFDPTGPVTVLVDDRMWATFSQDLRTLLPAAEFGLASAVLEPLRIRKDDVELETLRRAGAIADQVSLEIRERGDEFVGTTEAELASEIDRLLTAAGGVEPAFETIVAAGSNGARPHHQSGSREIRTGDPIVLDFGAFVPSDLDGGTARYPGDQTRTIVVGDPPDEYERVHKTVEEAQQAAVDAIEPGVTAGAIDRAARSVIDDAGYGDSFVHRTGHGVGLEVHEPPYIAAGNARELEPGMVFSVEPGIYLDGAFGVRIEDLVAVTETGAERLNDTVRGWETGR
ncbi:M24 family metallopeptidase [Natrinema halophilum]|uniref:Aminopeptidase P family protein n=1 Tax=Natrinema halophilum TaxID=1699371 RepID=A0A7D5GGV5_9EURY|nr:Xaa-Pro peptidase family protein [Natrinema halophilum]QLG48594.1 Xaa-Pro peptidase family protein [Natrinema halophilum]